MRHDRHIPAMHGLADRQDRIVTRADLLGLGMSDDVIRGLLRRELISAVFAGTYVVGSPRLTHREFLRSAVRHAGPHAYPSHRSGLELRGLLREKRGLATVTTRRRNVRSGVSSAVPLTDGGRGLVMVHASTPTLPLPVETVDGFETTLLPRTFVDAARFETGADLRYAWRQAQFKAILDEAAVELQLRDHRRAGNRRIRSQLARAPIVTRPGMDLRSKSGELRFLELIREAGLPVPEVNVPLQIRGRTYLADFLLRALGLVIETDGRQHDTPEAQEEDRVRDFEFFIAGFDVLRLSTERLRDEPSWCVERYAEAVARQSLRAA